MKEKYILSIKDLVVKFKLRSQSLDIIKGLSLGVFSGECLAIVGESGSGKTVLSKSIMGLLDKNGWIEGGSIFYKGVDLALYKKEKDWLKIRGKEISMVFQEPMSSLNPLKTVGNQIKESIVLHTDLNARECKKKAIELLKEVGIPNPEKRYKHYPYQLSGGMRQRVAIAIAIACRPKLLICDEPTTSLDLTIQIQILDLIKRIAKKYNLTIIYITHDFGVVANIADRVAVMYSGDIIEIGGVEDIFYNARHPYTWSLLSSLPQFMDLNTYVSDKEETRSYALNIDYIKKPNYYYVSQGHKVKSWLMDPRAPKINPPRSLRLLNKLSRGDKDG